MTASDISFFISLFFMIFAITSSILAILSSNRVYCALFLIVTIISSASLCIMIGADYLGISLIIIYVGTIVILFIFVIMMIGIDENCKMVSLYAKIALIFSVNTIFLSFICYTLNIKNFRIYKYISTKEIGLNVFERYQFDLQLAAIILLLSMVGSIFLIKVNSKSFTRYKQDMNLQKNEIRVAKMCEVKNGSGVNLKEIKE